MRLINSESQPIVVSFTDSGVPKTGLTPVIKIYKVSDGSDVTPVSDTLTEIGNGLYKYPSANLPDTSDDQLAFMIDGTATLTDDTERYKFGALVFGGYPDTLLNLLGSAVIQQPTTSVSQTSFSMTIANIIQMAHKALGEEVLYSEDSKRLLQSIVLNLQADGFFFWTTENEVVSFTEPSEVVVDSTNYTCYLSHTSSDDTKPGSGSDWESVWYEGGENGGAWAKDIAYTSTGDFYPDADTLDLEKTFVRYGNIDYPVKFISKVEYLEIAEKQETGIPTKLYFEEKPTPRIFLYPQPERDNVDNYLLLITRTRKIKNIDGNSEMSEDFPQAWIIPLMQELIATMAAEPRRGYAPETIMILRNIADRSIDKARNARANYLIERDEG